MSLNSYQTKTNTKTNIDQAIEDQGNRSDDPRTRAKKESQGHSFVELHKPKVCQANDCLEINPPSVSGQISLHRRQPALLQLLHRGSGVQITQKRNRAFGIRAAL